MTEGKEFFEQTTKPKREVLERLREEIVHKPKQPDEFTLTGIAEEFEIDRKVAEYRVNKLIRDGKVTSRKPGKERYYKFID